MSAENAFRCRFSEWSVPGRLHLVLWCLACTAASSFAHASIDANPVVVAYAGLDGVNARLTLGALNFGQHGRTAFDAAPSEQEYATLSGIGGIACEVNGRRSTATAFLVGRFDVAVTVAHAFNVAGSWVAPEQCFYSAVGRQGIILERIPLQAIRAQWQVDPYAYGVPANDLAVVRLARPSRLARRTLAFTRFAYVRAPVRLVGFRSQISMAALQRSPPGNVYSFRSPECGRFAHDIDGRNMAAGAPLIDARDGVVLGLHVRLTSSSLGIANTCHERGNVMIPMNGWLEETLRAEIQRPEVQVVSSSVPSPD